MSCVCVKLYVHVICFFHFLLYLQLHLPFYRQTFYNANSLSNLFTNVSGDTILQFLKEIDLYAKIQLYNMFQKYGFYLFNVSFIYTTPPPHRGCAGGRIDTRFLRPRGTSPLKGGNPGVQKWDRELLRLEGASVGCAGCKNSQPTRPADETYIKPRSCVERLPPSPHVKEPSVTAHDEQSIRDLLHWQNYPSLPITFPCFESRGA